MAALYQSLFRLRCRTIWMFCIIGRFGSDITFRNRFCRCNRDMPVLSVVPEPITLPSLSSNSTFVFGSVVTSTGSVVVALPVKSLVTTGAVGGVVSVAFRLRCRTIWMFCIIVSFRSNITFRNRFRRCNRDMPRIISCTEPITLPSLSNNSTFVFGSVVTSTGSVVVASPVKSLVTKGAVGALYQSLFRLRCRTIWMFCIIGRFGSDITFRNRFCRCNRDMPRIIGCT